jgi:hypothetical protein
MVSLLYQIQFPWQCTRAQKDLFMQMPKKPFAQAVRGLPDPESALPSGRKRGFCGVKDTSDAQLWEKVIGKTGGFRQGDLS